MYPQKNIISIHDSIIECRGLLSNFISSLDKLIGNPLYLTSSEILAKIFRQLANKAELSLNISEDKIDSLYKEHVSSELSEFEKGLILFELENEADNINKLIEYFRTLASYIRYIESSAIDEVPVSLLHYYDDVLKAADKKFHIILRRQWKPMFKYAEFIGQLRDPENIPKMLVPIFADINIKIAAIAYPILEKDNYFLLTQICH